MVGDDPQRNIILGVVAISDARNAPDMLHNILHRVDLKKIVHTLQDTGKSLEAEAGVYIGLCEPLVVALAVRIKLLEDDVPELDIAVAVTAHTAGLFAAAVLLAAVKIDLRAGAAGQ